VGNQPQVVEYEQSFGFVEVGEGELEGGGYKLKRNASTVVLTGDGLAQHQRQIESLERGMDDLRIEFERLKLQVLEFEEENHQWSLRYSRRMAVVANASLGAWIFWSRFILFVKRHKADLIQGWLRSSSASSSSPFSSSSSTSPAAVATRAAAPLLRRTKQSLVRQAIIGGGRLSKRATFNKLFTKGYMFAIRHSWVFLLSSYLITRKGARRWAGLIASTCYSVYLAFFTDTVPWTSYFTIFANLLYITACLKGMNDGCDSRSSPPAHTCLGSVLTLRACVVCVSCGVSWVVCVVVTVRRRCRRCSISTRADARRRFRPRRLLSRLA
jgi:hypothetical protein